MRKTLSYADAAVILGGKHSKVVKALDALAGGLLLLGTAVGSPTAIGLFDAKGEFARLGHELVAGLGEKVRGLKRYDRTERLTAAHAVIVLAAFFEAVQEIRMPVDIGQIGLSGPEQVSIGTGRPVDSLNLKSLVESMLRADIPLIVADCSYEENLGHLRDFYKVVGNNLGVFIRGLAIAEGDPTRQERTAKILIEQVPDAAVRRYEEWVRRLADEFPEVGFWISRAEHRATRREVRTGLAALERYLSEIRSDRPPDDRRAALTRGYQAALERGIAETGEVPEGMSIPSLGQAYLDHRFRAASVDSGSRPDQESWWEASPVRDDLPSYLLGYLTSHDAAYRPLIVLGQPGSGKSVLTKVLAARMPASDFLVIRVALREVWADDDLQTQVEHAIRSTTGETTSWPDLARSAGDALPVIILDGFDELLQATEASQSDYLEKAAAFQQREADQGRHVAIVVTSRTAVADRVRIPRGGTVALRLEPFNDDQIGRWLEVWNDANAGHFAASGLKALPLDAVLCHRHLAVQPLLLLMLAVYDANANVLQRGGHELNRAELYERLLTRFVEREVAKKHAGLEAAHFQRAVQEELERLSIAAFAMFNRDHQWVTADELDTDFTALLDADPVHVTGFRAPLTAAQALVGRFFFMHEAGALREGEEITTCEFLHATFGEFLMARMVTRELAALAEDAAFNAARNRSGVPDAALLHALLSFVPLSKRANIIDFLMETFAGIVEAQRAVARELALTWFSAALEERVWHHYDTYAPLRLPVTARHAIWAANLLLLAGIAGGRRIQGRELFPAASDAVKEWRDRALLWRSQLGGDGWSSMAAVMKMHRLWVNGRREVGIEITYEGPDPLDIDLYWSAGLPPGAKNRQHYQYFGDPLTDRKERRLLCTTDDYLLHAIEPLSFPSEHPTLLAVIGIPEDRCVSAGHALTRLWTASGQAARPEQLIDAYEDCFLIAECGFQDQSDKNTYFSLALRQLAADAHRLPHDWLRGIQERFIVQIRSMGEREFEWTAQAFAAIRLAPIPDNVRIEDI